MFLGEVAFEAVRYQFQRFSLAYRNEYCSFTVDAEYRSRVTIIHILTSHR